MRKSVVRKCLCIALASAMVFGEANAAFAAQSVNVQAQEETAVAADAAQIASVSDPAIWSAWSNPNSWDEKITVSASGCSKRVELWVNGKKVKTINNSRDDSYWNMDESIGTLWGSKYAIKVVAYNSAGKKVTKKLDTVTTNSPKVNDISGSALYSAGKTGYNQVMGATLYAYLDDYLKNVRYEVYRASKAGGQYKLIHRGVANTDSANSSISYTDNSALNLGTTYYYKIKLVTGRDKYVKTSRVISTSPAAKVKAEMGKTYVSVYPGDSYILKDMKNGEEPVYETKPSVTVSMSSGLANQYEIYRSTKEKSGYKKIATVYDRYYTDENIKKGTVYYYKVRPRYYSSATKKLYKGEMTDPVAAKYIMNSASMPTLTQTGDRTFKVEWFADNEASPDVSYELWYKRQDLKGDAYKKIGVTKNGSYVFKNAAPDGEYSVVIRTVKKTGSVVRYEISQSSGLQMGYTDQVYGFMANVTSSSVISGGRLRLKCDLSWQRDWNASGYIVTAYDNYNGKEVRLANIKRGKRTTYTFYNINSKKSGTKYSDVKVIPYRNGKLGNDNYGESWSVSALPSVSSVNVVRANSGASKITWKKVNGAKSYAVYRESALGYRTIIGITTKTSFIDRNLTNDLVYTYSVETTNSYTGVHDQAANYYVAYTHMLGTPRITAISNSGKRSVAIRCGKVSKSASYIVYRSTSRNGTYKKVGRMGKNLRFVDKNLKKGQTYYYKIVARTVNDGGKTVISNASAVRSVKIRK